MQTMPPVPWCVLDSQIKHLIIQFLRPQRYEVKESLAIVQN
jgi:hypothetical protein